MLRYVSLVLWQKPFLTDHSVIQAIPMNLDKIGPYDRQTKGGTAQIVICSFTTNQSQVTNICLSELYRRRLDSFYYI